jgi:hypothetical protein
MESSELSSDEPLNRNLDSGELPAWALAHADAALQCGLKAPEIEALLIKKGLSPATATAVVPRCMELRIQAVQRLGRRAARWKMINRAASLVVAAGFLVVGWLVDGPHLFLMIAASLLFPLACIWFPRAFTKYEPLSWGLGPYIDRKTPVFFAVLGGWLILVAVPLVVFAISLMRGVGPRQP